MEIKIIQFVNLLLYSIIVSQSFSYIISLTAVQLQMDASNYIPFRQATDKAFHARYKPVVYASLVTNIILLAVTAAHITGIIFITTLIALLALAGDIVIALKGNIPINNMINEWTIDQYPSDWKEYRVKWLSLFQKRQFLNIIGFMSLLAGAVFS